MIAHCPPSGAYNMEISDYLKEEITGTYSDYIDEQVEHKFLHVQCLAQNLML